MSWLRRLERKLQPFAIPNLTPILIAGQVLIYVEMIVDIGVVERLVFYPGKVWQGEWWRIFTFLIIPSIGDPLHPWWMFVFIVGMIGLYFIGSVVEQTWGTLRYNVFILVGYLSSIVAAIVASRVLNFDAPATNGYLYASILYAFAWYYPEFEFRIYFVIPVKAKWLAMFSLAFSVFAFLGGLGTFFDQGWLTCTLISISHLNISLFLGREIAARLRSHGTKVVRQLEASRRQQTARHVCIVCGASDLTHPDREFRYCTDCQGTPAYCNQHLAGHKHLEIATQLEKK